LTYEMVYNLISNNRQDTFNIVYEWLSNRFHKKMELYEWWFRKKLLQ
jgi:hypothetical protein